MPTPNIKVVSYQVRQVIADDFGETFTEIETRYRVVDADTGEVLDDAQGYGYTSAQKAHRGFAYKQKHHPLVEKMRTSSGAINVSAPGSRPISTLIGTNFP